ncbi:hypothetical protein ONR57_14855 [Hoyosella sp. YIM 151337]|uniref:hypothetical protein n=1 Tax=Hoyosella sp. YIM 151337 TaxID=2992742 RepID=UPI00223576DD|nr:hypothetical protein [Hoyosella sp. YIM 151337]MCW4354584.1 hypothetical protein [Hoyosella sp. YIM 151337]
MSAHSESDPRFPDVLPGRAAGEPLNANEGVLGERYPDLGPVGKLYPMPTGTARNRRLLVVFALLFGLPLLVTLVVAVVSVL